MKHILFLFLALSLNVNAQKKAAEFIVTGKIGDDTKGYNKVYSYGVGIKDSAQIIDGVFRFSFPFEKPMFPLFYTEYDLKVKRGYQPFGILVDKPGAVSISIDHIADGFNKATVTGLPSSVSYQSFVTDRRKIYVKVSGILKERFGKSWVPENDPAYEKINRGSDSLLHLFLHPFIVKYVKEHKDSYAGVFVLNENKNALGLADTEKSYLLLKEELKTSDLGKSIADYIDGVRNSLIGSVAGNFIVQTTDDKPFSFDQLKGKFVVLDFWASWCGPCRKSFPHMRELYKKYQGKNVEFLNISIDSDRNAWLKAVEKEGNPWPQTLDTKNVSLKMFAVTSIPTTYLIDPDGKILIKEIGFNSSGNGDIENKLKEVLGN